MQQQHTGLELLQQQNRIMLSRGGSFDAAIEEEDPRSSKRDDEEISLLVGKEQEALSSPECYRDGTIKEKKVGGGGSQPGKWDPSRAVTTVLLCVGFLLVGPLLILQNKYLMRDLGERTA